MEEMKDQPRLSISDGSDKGKISINKTLELDDAPEFPSLLAPKDPFGMDITDMIVQNQMKQDDQDGLFDYAGSLTMNEGLQGINLLQGSQKLQGDEDNIFK